MDTPAAQPQPIRDSWMAKFFAHLATDRGASAYTQRNYRQALTEFVRWHLEERKAPVRWDGLQRDDFRGYLRFLGRSQLSRAAIQLRFSALRTFYKFQVYTHVTTERLKKAYEAAHPRAREKRNPNSPPGRRDAEAILP